ncbi:MAG: hypothetical protein J6J23_02990 [Clostridia bacterium]|nr:hypothetical protein [Clostridia bacterium]
MNKKKLVGWIISGVLAVGAIGGTTAGVVIANHEHKYSTEWTFDEVNHWHNATCSHEEQISGLEAHSWDEGVVTEPSCTAKGFTTFTCTVCGATKTGNVTEMLPHIWNNGIITPPTCTEKGFTTYTCTKCGGTKVENYTNPTGHSFSTSWSSDSTHHWHTSTCEHNDVISDKIEHSIVVDYTITGQENSISSVSKQDRCIICSETHDLTIMNSSDYVVLNESNLTSNAITLNTPNTVYVLNGAFSSSTFNFDAPNITLIGSYATTSKINLNFTANASNSIIYEIDLATNKTYNVYGDISVIKCALNYLTFNLQANEINALFDSNSITGEYGIYVNTYKAKSMNCNVFITNNTFNAMGIYSIFLSADDAESELGKIEIANNKFINGWGVSAPGAKRATLKIHNDKNICPIQYGDTNDTSKLTDSAINLVNKILASNNTYDKAGKTCSYFNIDGIYFDTLE